MYNYYIPSFITYHNNHCNEIRIKTTNNEQHACNNNIILKQGWLQRACAHVSSIGEATSWSERLNSVKQWSYEAVNCTMKLRSYEAVKLWSCEAIWSCEAMKLWSYEAEKLWSCQWSYEAVKPRSLEAAGLRSSVLLAYAGNWTDIIIKASHAGWPLSVM